MLLLQKKREGDRHGEEGHGMGIQEGKGGKDMAVRVNGTAEDMQNKANAKKKKIKRK